MHAGSFISYFNILTSPVVNFLFSLSTVIVWPEVIELVFLRFVEQRNILQNKLRIQTNSEIFVNYIIMDGNFPPSVAKDPDEVQNFTLRIDILDVVDSSCEHRQMGSATRSEKPFHCTIKYSVLTAFHHNPLWGSDESFPIVDGYFD